jgi:hypothetical protein
LQGTREHNGVRIHPVTIALFSVTLICQASEFAAGRWEGEIQIPARELKLIIDLAADGRGGWTGSAIVPGFGIKGAPLTDIVVKDSAVSFTLKGALGEPKITGLLADNGAFTGEFEQAGNKARFTLQKTGPPQVDSPRRSTSVRHEMEGEWTGVMDLFGYPIHVALTLANQGGSAMAKFHIVGKRENTVKLDLVIEENDNLALESPETGIVYEGRFRPAASEINGVYRQGPYEGPLILRRAVTN